MSEKPKGNDSMAAGLMAGKKGIILGLANDKSIAWGIASQLHQAGATLGFTYQGEVLEKRVRPLAQSLGADFIEPCEVTRDEDLDQLFAKVKAKFGTIDFLVHAIAFADKNELTGEYLATSRKNFLNSLDISCYSLTALAQRADKLMPNGGSLVTLTYYGAERVMPHYNVMGVAKAALEASVKYLAMDMGKRNIRVNAISAGPIKTLAAAGIGDFRFILKWNEINSPLRRNVTIDDVGKTAVYLLSDLSSGVSGEVLHVDSGYHITGMAQDMEKTSALLKEFNK